MEQTYRQRLIEVQRQADETAAAAARPHPSGEGRARDRHPRSSDRGRVGYDPPRRARSPDRRSDNDHDDDSRSSGSGHHASRSRARRRSSRSPVVPHRERARSTKPSTLPVPPPPTVSGDNHNKQPDYKDKVLSLKSVDQWIRNIADYREMARGADARSALFTYQRITSMLADHPALQNNAHDWKERHQGETVDEELLSDYLTEIRRRVGMVAPSLTVGWDANVKWDPKCNPICFAEELEDAARRSTSSWDITEENMVEAFISAIPRGNPELSTNASYYLQTRAGKPVTLMSLATVRGAGVDPPTRHPGEGCHRHTYAGVTEAQRCSLRREAGRHPVHRRRPTFDHQQRRAPGLARTLTRLQQHHADGPKVV